MRLDACTSEMWVDADPLRHHDIDLRRRRSAPVARAGYGGFLNLDFSYGGLAGRNAVDSVLDLGLFGPAGAGRSDFFVGSDAVRRLDTYWIHDEPGSAVRLLVGDSITHAADWESPVRFGGVQWGTDFALQPDRITFPLPGITGSAALPSTAQLYVNGVQQSQQPLQPGQFRFDSVPTITGAGDLTVMIRDSLGRVQTVTQPFYTSPRLLAAGLDADTLEAGFLRDNYASVDDHYAQPFLATTLQHGYSNEFSGLLRASASARRQLMGLEGDTIVSPLGVLTISGAAAHTEAGTGGIATLAFERQANDLSVTLSRRAATRDYGDLGRDPRHPAFLRCRAAVAQHAPRRRRQPHLQFRTALEQRRARRGCAPRRSRLEPAAVECGVGLRERPAHADRADRQQHRGRVRDGARQRHQRQRAMDT